MRKNNWIKACIYGLFLLPLLWGYQEGAVDHSVWKIKALNVN